MYFAHAQHAPRKLERRGHATWSLVRVAFDDGPYLNENGDSARTLKPAATTGNGIAITATGHAPFKEGDVGRPLRLRPTGEPGRAVLTEFVSPEQVESEERRVGREGVRTWRSRWSHYH